MEIKRISYQNFGLRITDNMSLQILRYMWARKSSQAASSQAFLKIKNAADDSFVLTVDKIYDESPEFLLRKNPYPPEKVQVEFYNLKDVVLKKKRGRPKKNPAHIIQKEPVSPLIVADKIEKAVIAYRNKYKV